MLHRALAREGAERGLGVGLRDEEQRPRLDVEGLGRPPGRLREVFDVLVAHRCGQKIRALAPARPHKFKQCHLR